VIGTALEQMGSRLNERPLTLTVPATLPLVQMDFVLIAHVLINLLDNALKYSPAGSPLEISAQLHGTTVEIAVTDHGPGLSQEDLERVFDKFYRASPTAWTTGIGLGLSISKGIVEAHGGQIWAQNHPTGGLCVHLTLPLTAPPLLKNSHAQHSDC
jgi:two-component system sensor histidine kinase KdpD